MRYTTIIDITEYPAIYANHNTRLVYLHMALRSGYHDDDRDILNMSIRQLAMAVGLSVSATRHALRVLEKAGLLTHVGGVWKVKKWIIQETITPRLKTRRQEQAISAAAERAREAEKREREKQIEELRRQQLHAQGTDEFIIYHDSLKERAAAGDAAAISQLKRFGAAMEQRRHVIELELKQEKQ